MKTLAHAMLLIGLSLSSSIAAMACPLDSVNEIPFTLEKGHLIVSARIKGNTPVEVVLATGSENSLINGNLLDKYKLQTSYGADGIVTGGHLDKIKFFVRMSEMQLGTRIYPVKATFHYKTFYRSGTQVSQNWIRILNFYVKAFGEWEIGSEESVKMGETVNIPRDQ